MTGTRAGTGAADLSRPIANGATPLSNDDLRIRFPEKDFDGYWLVGGIRGDERFQAMFLGFGLGVNDGYDWGFREVIPDTNFSLYVIRLITADDAVTYVEQPINRHQFEYDRTKLDVRLEDRVRITAEWPHVSYYMASPDKSVVVQFQGEMSISHWSRDMAMRGTSWTTVAMPDLEYEGTISLDGDERPFSGIATLDHPSGRLFKSPTSPGAGYWEYNAFMLNDAFGLYQLKMVDGNGELMSSEAITNFPDGKKHVGEMELEYTQFEDRGTIGVPRQWRCVVRADHGTLEYTVTAVGQDANGTPHVPGDPFPNFLLLVEGEFTGNDGKVMAITGKGSGETVISGWDPQKNERRDPW
ncbi:MAG: hypothetical protein QOK00_2697 [Thermoleophilaceae bacterium]|jgi:hypothetical protein|nr:hypothetical protein [Thermoleophilaceae bacterium]MEA2402294.1 hypothetical protein [Thermoleophilaceae bacterium]